jgi:SAM-dependent methyltransferase
MNLYKPYYDLRLRSIKRSSRLMYQDCKDFIQKGEKVIDIGCGSGIIGEYFANAFGANVIGVDVKDDRIVDLPFQIIDGRNLPFEDNEFDICLISYVLHHADDPLLLLEEAKRVCKGKIIIYEDLPDGLLPKLRCRCHLLLTSFLTGVFNQEFKFKTQHEWEKAFDELGLVVFEKKRVFKSSDWLDPGKRIFYVLEKVNEDGRLSSEYKNTKLGYISNASSEVMKVTFVLLKSLIKRFRIKERLT